MKKWIPLLIFSTSLMVALGNNSLESANNNTYSSTTFTWCENTTNESAPLPMYEKVIRIQDGIDKDEIILQDVALSNALKANLRLSPTDKLYKDSIISNPLYKPTETTTPGNYTATKISLDFSNIGITDIRELCQFVWPSTLTGINLAQNGITNELLDNIFTFTELTTGQTIDIDGREITSISNISDILTKVNLIGNSIVLNELSTPILNNTKLIYGIQQIEKLDHSHIILKNELEENKVQFYFRTNDLIYTKPRVIRNNTEIWSDTYLNNLKGLCDENILGNISWTVSGDGPFKGWSYSFNINIIEFYLNNSFAIERKEPFPNKDTLSSNLYISPELKSKITWDMVSANPTTNRVGDYTANASICIGDLTRIIPLKYTVIDTVAPVLEAVGPLDIYWSRNKKFDYERYTCRLYDSGDLLKTTVIPEEYIDETVLGVQTLIYKGSDGFNEAIPLIRRVHIQEKVLDTVTISSLNNNITTNSDIILEIKPEGIVDISKYTNLEYTWHIDGKIYKTTGDSISGVSTKAVSFSTPGIKEIQAVLTATQTENGERIEIYSSTLFIDVKPQTTRGNINLIIIIVAVISTALLSAILLTLAKRKKTSNKKKSDRTSKANQNSGIQVIKDYDPNKPNSHNNN